MMTIDKTIKYMMVDADQIRANTRHAREPNLAFINSSQSGRMVLGFSTSGAWNYSHTWR
jgi:hypothetical protein